ncbi:unnamed protein product, partial [Citrullus colocynthis]
GVLEEHELKKINHQFLLLFFSSRAAPRGSMSPLCSPAPMGGPFAGPARGPFMKLSQPSFCSCSSVEFYPVGRRLSVIQQSPIFFLEHPRVHRLGNCVSRKKPSISKPLV